MARARLLAAGRPEHSGTAVTEGFVHRQAHASYLHTHWNGIPGAADRLTATARAYRKARVTSPGGTRRSGR